MRGKRKLADIMSLPGYSPRQPVIFTKVKDEKKLFVEWYYIKFCRRSQKAQNKVISLPNGLQCANPPSCSSLLWSLKDVLQFNRFCFGFLLFNIASISLIAVQNQCYFCEIFIKKIAGTTMLECVLWCYHLIVWVLCSVFSIRVRLSHLFFCGCDKQWKEFLHKIKQTDLTVTVCSTLARSCNYRMAEKKSH